MKVLLSWLIAILLLTSSKADELDADQVRLAYDSFVGKFKKPGGPDGYALTNIGGFWQIVETTEVFIDAYERFKDDTTKQNMIDVVDSWLNGHDDNWEWNDYNDDIMWAVIMLTRSYLILENSKYLDATKNNFQMVGIELGLIHLEGDSFGTMEKLLKMPVLMVPQQSLLAF